MRRLAAKILGCGLVIAFLLAASVIGFAQSDNSQVSGFVKDQSGAVVAGAKITVKHETREFERTTTTNSEGYYVVPNLPPGLYTITAEANGFKLYRASGKKLDPNIASSVDVSLETGQLTETVNITASTAAVQTETSTVGKLVEGKQIELLQLNGRNPLFLASLKPGVSSGNSLSRFSFGLDSGGFNVNGARGQDTLITYDGAVGIRTRSNGTSVGVADLDATQEIQILAANYSAEYGRSAGGQIRIVTRSGTKDFHGNFYEYIRNSAFNANDWGRNRNTPANQPCDNPAFEKASHCRPNPYRYNQFGYNLSGPVIIPGTGFNKDRNKLFWLWGQEWIRFRQGANSTSRVPTLKMRQGDFSELLTANPFFSTPQFIRDPLKTGACNAADQTACFPGNIIPANRVSANGLGLLRAYPEPIPGFVASGGNNYFIERPATTDQRKDTLSLDFIPNERHSIKFRMALYHFLENSGLFGSFDRAPRIFDRPNQTASIGWTWSLSPTWISEVLVAGSRDQVFIGVDTTNGAFRRGQYGINYPYIFPDRKEIPEKIPTININSFATVDGGPYPAQSTGPIYQINNNWTNIRGSHTIKFGGYFERAGQNDFDQINVSNIIPGSTNNQNGRFEFINSTPGGTGLAIANAALGVFDSYGEIGARSFTPYRGHMFEWFIQDSWKATPKLRLEFGLRHTIIQPYYSLWRNMVIFDPTYYDPSIAVTQNPGNGYIIGGDLRSRYNGLLIPGDSWPPSAAGRVPLVNDPNFSFLFRGEPKQYSDINYDNFQPRVGFAYAFNDKNVLRAGAGRFLTRLGVSDSVFLGGNPPLQPTVSVSAGSVDNPGGTGGNAFPLVVTTQERKFRMPEAWTWNVMFEREIGYNTTVEVGYVGRRGLHGQRERNLNQPVAGTRFLAANAGKNIDVLRPFKGYGAIRITGNEANSIYHGFQVGANRRFSNGFLFGVAYTLSKSDDNGSAQRDVIPNAYDASPLWSPSDFDRRHVLVVNAAYVLPIFRDKSKFTGKVFGGWTLSGVSQWQSGTPFSISFGDDDAGVGPGSGSQLAIVNGDPKLSGGDRAFASNNSDPAFWFRTTNGGSPIFSRPPQGTFNNSRVRNLLYRPGLQSHNIGLFKDFSITERHRITFRAEAFNWPNHPNWNTPDTNPRNATFGKVTAKGDFAPARQLQFALRYQF
jgi:hypothetical protein